MNILQTYLEQINEWNETSAIGPTDISNASDDLDISRFTIWAYIRKQGKNVNTAEQIYNYFKSVVDTRRERLEKSEILKTYTHDTN